jgi:hypothetical protein
MSDTKTDKPADNRDRWHRHPALIAGLTETPTVRPTGTPGDCDSPPVGLKVGRRLT